MGIENAGGAAHKRNGNKHGRHYQGNRHNGPRNLAHGVGCGHLRRVVVVVQLGMHRFHHHNRIVHHNGNGQYQGKEGEQVDGKAEYFKEEECADNGHRHGHRGNEG